MPSKIVANERVGINLPVYRFNAFLGHYQGFSAAWGNFCKVSQRNFTY